MKNLYRQAPIRAVFTEKGLAKQREAEMSEMIMIASLLIIGFAVGVLFAFAVFAGIFS